MGGPSGPCIEMKECFENLQTPTSQEGIDMDVQAMNPKDWMDDKLAPLDVFFGNFNGTR